MRIPRLLKSPLFIILAIAIISYWPVSFCVYTFKWDMLDVVLPFRYFAGECIKNGIFPLWNPYQLTGSPIYADLQYPLWSPEVWLVGLTTGYNIYVLHILFIFYIFLAGYGMYRLVLHFTGNHLTSLATGISYMLCGFFVGHGQALFSIIGASFLPWVILYVIKKLTDPSLRNTLKLALFIFLQLATGYQAITVITGYLMFFIFLYYLSGNLNKRDHLISIIKFNGLLLLLVFLLCLVILIPVLQVSGFNDRLSGGLTYKQAKIFPFTINCLISLFTPFATVKYPGFFNTDLSMRNFHFGLIMLIFFAVALLRKKTGLQWVMLLFGFICFLASFGDALPVHNILYNHLPLFNRLRMPAYLILFTIFSILFITGIHLPGLLSRISTYRISLIVLASSTLGILVFMSGYSVFHINFGESIIRKIFHQPHLIPEGLTFYENVAIQSVFQGVLLILMLITLVKRSFFKHAAKMLPVLIVIEMSAAVNLNIYYTVVSTTKPSELNDYMISQPKGFPLPDGTRITDNSDKKLIHAPFNRNMGILTKRISYDGFTSFILKPYNYLYDSLPRLKDSLLSDPLVYLSGRVKKITTLKDPQTSFTRKDLYVSDSIFAILPPGLKKDLSKNKVNILAFSPVKLKVQYSADSSSVITVMQADYPGWVVKTDGKVVRHFTSNKLYLSAIAPAGNHEVVFEYHNPVAVICFIVSYSVLILMIMLLMYLNYRSSSPLKARLFPVSIAIFALICSFIFISNKSLRKKENVYKIFADSLTKWNTEFAGDSFASILNVDDTTGFNHMAGNKSSTGIKYFRFNETRDLGEFYRYVLTSGSKHLAYGYYNLYNPAETEFMITQNFPVRARKLGTTTGGMAMYSRSGNGETAKAFYSSMNDFKTPSPDWQVNANGYDSIVAPSGNFAEKMDSVHIYSSTFRKKLREIPGKKEIYLVITAKIFLSGNSNPLLVFEQKNGDESKKWLSLDVRKFVKYDNLWEKVFFVVKAERNRSSDDSVGIFFWNQDKSTFYLDQFKVEAYLVNGDYSK